MSLRESFHSELLQALLCRPPGGGYGAFGRLLHEAVPYDRLTLCAVEEDGLRIVQALCAGDATSEAVGRLIPHAGSLAGAVLRGGRPLRISELSRTLGTAAEAPEDVLRALRAGMQSGLLMPLGSSERFGERAGDRPADRPVGLCQLWSRAPGCFSGAHEELLAHLGPALGAALQSDVLFAQAERRSLELGALERLSRKTRETLSLEQVVPTCLDTALSLVGQPTGGLLLLRGDRLELACERNLPGGLPQATPATVEPGAEARPLQAALRDGHAVLCEDLRREPALGEPLRRQGKGWLLAIPLLAGQERCGVVFASGPGIFPQGPAELERLTTVGAWLGTAIAEAERQAQARQREAQQRRVQHLESLGSLAGGLAHDLNNTLSTVLCTALLVRDQAARGQRPEGPQLLGDMDAIAAAARRGAQLAGQLLSFSRGAPLSLQLLDVNALVGDALAALRAGAGVRGEGAEPRVEDGKGLRLETILGAELPRVRGDREQLLRALLNLLRNAEEALEAHGGGRLLVRTQLVADRGEGEAKGPFVRLSVQDDGPGVDPTVRGRLFEPFVTTKKSAAGLGLAVVFGVLRAHGGHAAVDHNAGAGTTFHLDLPPAEALRPAAPAPVGLGAAARVLVVDDEPALGRVAARILGRGGHQVDIVDSGKGALERYAGPGAYDLVILDSTMPGMSGREVLDELLRRDPAARVLVMSGYSSDGGPAQLLREGARAFLPKPFTPLELLQAAQAVLLDPLPEPPR